jgi:methylated-DNA-[protein]-cysteine S-methyltransferase
MQSFSQKVYAVAAKIPRGKVLTYAQVAKLAGSPKASRAVGNILNKNRDKKVFCHRVIRSDGSVGGFAFGNSRKIKILRSEGVKIQNGKVFSISV